VEAKAILDRMRLQACGLVPMNIALQPARWLYPGGFLVCQGGGEVATKKRRRENG
jgi:hypothetical protein